MAPKSKTGVAENWIVEESAPALISEAKKQLKMAKQEEIGKKYIRIPHPTLKNTFILKEKK
jgi:hypothetical protein